MSVGLALYNDEKCIAKSLESVLNQTFQDFVIHVFDNNSTDSSLEIVEKYQKKDSRIFIHKNSINIGFAANVQRCLEIGESKYVSLKSSNDVLHPEYYEKCIKLLDEDENAVLAYSRGSNKTNPNAIIPYDDDLVFSRIKKTITSPCYGNSIYGVYRRDVIDKILPMKDFQGNDHIFTFNLALLGKLKMVKEVLYYRDVPSRTEEDYMRICHSNRSQAPDIEPNIKLIEMLLGYIDVIENTYLNDSTMDRNKLINIVVDIVLKKYKFAFYTQYEMLLKFVKTQDKNTVSYKKYKALSDTLQVYLSPISIFRYYKIRKQLASLLPFKFLKKRLYPVKCQ